MVKPKSLINCLIGIFCTVCLLLGLVSETFPQVSILPSETLPPGTLMPLAVVKEMADQHESYNTPQKPIRWGSVPPGTMPPVGWTSLGPELPTSFTLRALIIGGNPYPISIGTDIGIAGGVASTVLREFCEVRIGQDVVFPVVLVGPVITNIAPVYGFIGFHITACDPLIEKYIEGYFLDSVFIEGGIGNSTAPDYGVRSPAVNHPPSLAEIGNKSINEGDTLYFQVNASDPDGDPILFFSASNLPTGASFDPVTHTLTWIPTYAQSGVYPNVLFTVTDNGTPPQSASEAITITVGDVNRLPVLNPLGPKTVDEGQVLQFSVIGSDLDGDALTFSASNLPTGASFDPVTHTLTWIPTYAQSGVYPNVLFTVTDNGTPPQSAYESITITVGDVNRPPVLNPIGSMSVNEEEMLQFTVTANDPDGNGLTYSASNLPIGASFDPVTQTFTWTPTYEQSGNYLEVLFTVTDDGTPPQSAYESITITVGDVNRPPVLNPIGDKTVNESETLTFIVTASDPDGGNGLTYSSGKLPTGAMFNPTTQTFTWIPASGQAGTYPGIYFEVSDGLLADSEEILITVTNLPDLTGEWSVPLSYKKGTTKGTLLVRNIGTLKAGKFNVAFYLSNDIRVDNGDTKISTKKINSLAPGTSISLGFSYSGSTGGRFVLAVVDSDNQIVESKEGNNVIPAQIP